MWRFQEDKPVAAEDFFSDFYRAKSLDKYYRNKKMEKLGLN
jgi:hypothetical protein